MTNLGSVLSRQSTNIKNWRNLVNRRSTLLVAMVLFAALIVSACTSIVAQPQTQTFELQSLSHIAMGLPEQDVYIEREPGSGQVVRVAPGEEAEALDMPIYAAAEMVDHNLFATGDAPFGPYVKGQALGMTLGEWLAAGGQGTYTVTGDRLPSSI